MDYLYLGNSGPRVSKYILGSVTFGGTHGFEPAGDVQVDDARRLIDIAMEAGINASDTANLYSMGDAEKTLGAALKGRRDDVMLFSKTGFQIGDEANAGGSSRVHLMRAIEDSLQRLQTDHLDLYFVHLWDGRTPVEETVEAMSRLVDSGKIRYWGVSNYSGWALARGCQS